MIVEILVIDKHLRIFQAVALHSNGYAAIAEVCVHHIGQNGIFFTQAIDHDAEQFAAPFVFVAVEHLHGEEVIGRGADIRVEYHEGHSLVLRLFWLYGVVIIVRRT